MHGMPLSTTLHSVTDDGQPSARKTLKGEKELKLL
jgi:hypothetical protein